MIDARSLREAARRLEEDDRAGVMLGVSPDACEIFVGTGPEDPERWTWSVPSPAEAVEIVHAFAAVGTLLEFPKP